MFKGKSGPRIFKKKRDAERVVEINSPKSSELAAVKIRVINSELAQENGMSVHPDISIAARVPEDGEAGWIVTKGKDKISEKFGKALEIVQE